jgi:hypothetical protein
VLAKLAVEDEDDRLRLAAVEKLTDQALLAKLAAEGKDSGIRIVAIGRLTDQAALCQLSDNDPQAAIRQAAVAGVTDDGYLVRRLAMEPSAAVREAIVATLRGGDSLRDVALGAYHANDRVQALQRLRKVVPTMVSDVEAGQKAIKQQADALAGETSGDKLLRQAISGKYDVVRFAAAKALNEPSSVEAAAVKSDDREVLKILLAKLNDKAVLGRIAVAEGADPAMRLAAAYKAGRSWIDIFTTATNRDTSGKMLGDAMAAVSLFPSVQADAKEGVQRACLNLIRRGSESRIPEMVDLLEAYGDKTLAEDYLNCGQPDLDAAGRKWAGARGYNISTGSGSQRATWGIDR